MPNILVEFYPEEIIEIRDMVTKDVPVLCPRCGARLTSGRPVPRGVTQGLVWRLSCRRCNLTTLSGDMQE
jgi:hypothetical protein